MKVNDQLQRMEKKVVKPKFKVLSEHLPEGIKENRKELVRIVCVNLICTEYLETVIVLLCSYSL
jgi:hypothetical protein